MAFDLRNDSDLTDRLERALDRFGTAIDPPEVHARFQAELESAAIKRALEFVPADIDDPNDRLALQLALKVRHRMTAAP